MTLKEERVGAVGEELVTQTARLDIRESELGKTNSDIQKKLDNAGEYNVGKYLFTS